MPTDHFAEFRESVRGLAEAIADIAEIQPHARRLFIERFVERQYLLIADWLIELEESFRPLSGHPARFN